MTKPTLENMPEPITRLLGLYDECTRMEKQAAFTYYAEQLHSCSERARTYNLPVAAVVGVMAALSPNQSEKVMWMAVDRMLSGSKKPPSYSRDINKAKEILQGTPMEHVLGRKTLSFYRNTIDPSNHDRVVTVDGHMFNAYHGVVVPLNTVDMNARLYDTIEAAIRECASRRRVRPSAFQAAVWSKWKQTHGIVFTGQKRLIPL